jgi:flagella basal body P-ring formation protein FlgA
MLMVTVMTLAPLAWAWAQPPVALAAQTLERQILERHALHRLHLEPLASGPSQGSADADAMQWEVMATDKALRRQMSVLLKARAEAGRDTLLRVSFKGDATRLAWRTTHDLEAAQALGEEVAVRDEIDALISQDAVQADSLAGYRSRLGLPAGHILRERDIADLTTLLRGDAVRVIYETGAIAVQTQGRLLDPARIGQSTRVAISGSREPVRAVVVDAGQVKVLAARQEQP